MAETVRLAEWMLASHKTLQGQLGPDLFADPALQILLDLYVSRAHDRAVPTSAACMAAGVPTTTALRWINILARRDMVVKRPHPTDRRFTYLELSPAAVESLETYLRATLKRLDHVLGD